jgi:hypothetical protein
LSFTIRVHSAITPTAAFHQEDFTAERTFPWVEAELRVDTLLEKAATLYAGHLNIGTVGAAALRFIHSFALMISRSQCIRRYMEREP